MVDFVLIHGGWGGGWEWAQVGELLLKRGHNVLRPSLTGLGDRAHLLGPDVGLSTHVADVVSLIESEELQDYVLCGHSYAGAVISSAAGLVAPIMRRLVFLDAFVPDEGESVFDMTPEWLVHEMIRSADSVGDGWRIPLPFPAPEHPGRAKALEYYRRTAAHPMSIKCFEEPVALSIPEVDVSYFRCMRFDEDFMGPSSVRAVERGWHLAELDAPHDAAFFEPESVAEALISVI